LRSPKVTIRLGSDELTELRRLVSAAWADDGLPQLEDLCTKLDEALIEVLQADVRERKAAR
jgi:hypothetical protein